MNIEEKKQELRALEAQIKAMEGKWPEIDDEYWVMTVDGPEAMAWEGMDSEFWLQARSAIFMSRDACVYDDEREQAMTLLLNEVVTANHKNDWAPDFGAPRQAKYYPTYEYQTRSLSVTHDFERICVPVELLSTNDVWLDLIERYRESVKLVLGVERKGHG